MAEHDMRQNVHDALRPLHAVSVETRNKDGIPDTNVGGALDLPPGFEGTDDTEPYQVEAWIEHKWARDWPKRAGTPLRFEHFSPQQRAWIGRRWDAGGNVWVLVQVLQDWMLFDGPTACEVVGQACRAVMMDRACRIYRGLQQVRERLRYDLTR